MPIELYINNQLCDIESPDKLSVYLKRQLLNPTELKTKDAQRSYSITLPATATNNAILGYKNTEEVSRKFNEIFNSRLLVGGVEVFDGKFKITEITKDSYKGNLAVPKAQTIKDLFGDKMMNEAGEWNIDFKDGFIKEASKYNEQANPECFFPYALYGLPNKKDTGSSPNFDSLKDVELYNDDLPPSINCLKAIKKIFENEKEASDKDIQISGTAFNDGRLSNLYMSYKNPEDYPMEWYGGSEMNVNMKGSWTNLKDKRGNSSKENQETEVVCNKDYNEIGWGAYSCDLFKARQLKKYPSKEGNKPTVDDIIITDDASNVIKTKKQGMEGYDYVIEIPQDGFYKIQLSSNIELYYKEGEKHFAVNLTAAQGERLHTAAANSQDWSGFLNNSRHEVKLIRDRKEENGHDLSEMMLDGVYFEKNQGVQVVGDNHMPENAIFPTPSYYAHLPHEHCEVLYVDPAQNNNIICGLSWGTLRLGGTDNRYGNPLDTNKNWARVLAAKPGYSWDGKKRDLPPTLLGINSNGYSKIVDNSAESLGYSHMIVLQQEYRPGKEGEKGEVNSEYISTCFTNDEKKGGGVAECVVWLEKGEKLTLVTSSERKIVKDKKPAWIIQDINFFLDVRPMTTQKSWYNVNRYSIHGDLTVPKNKGDFGKKDIDLIKFLPSNVKINDWLDNFCKAFNLELIEKEKNKFELNVRNNIDDIVGLILDLDKKADVNIGRANTDLGFPSEYSLGFKVDTNEQGYAESQEDGGGSYPTNSINEKITEQKSDFSYNWFKEMSGDNGKVNLPIISHKEVWESDDEYAERMKKRYTDNAQRFWYKKNATYSMKMRNQDEIKVGLVENSVGEDKNVRPMTLDYKQRTNSILDNYFTVFVDGNSNYTELECYLTPEEYANIDISLAKFNGDLYYIAEVDGYDPLGKKKAKVKLIKKEV